MDDGPHFHGASAASSRRNSIDERLSPGAGASSPSPPAMYTQEQASAYRASLEAQFEARLAAALAAPTKAQQQQAAAAAPMTELGLARALAAAAPLLLPPFDGAGNTSGVAAQAWIRQVERAFAQRRSEAGHLTEERALTAVGAVLRGEADNWYASLSPAPTTWDGFKAALLKRFQPANAAIIHERQIKKFVALQVSARERHTTQSLEKYTALFQQQASMIPSNMMDARTRLLLYADGLPKESRKITQRADEDFLESGTPIVLNNVIDKVLKRSAQNEAVGAHAAPRGDSMDLSIVELCERNFGLSTAEALAYTDKQEGWPEYDTDLPTSGGSQGPSSVSLADLQRQLAATQLQLSALSRDRQSPAVKKAVPQELVDAREAAGLCIKCGVEPYSRGGNGHNARTCKQPADLTTYPKGAPKQAAPKKPVFRDARQ